MIKCNIKSQKQNHLQTEQVSNKNIYLKNKTNSHWEWTQLAQEQHKLFVLHTCCMKPWPSDS
jgi:hypothetical protein